MLVATLDSLLYNLYGLNHLSNNTFKLRYILNLVRVTVTDSDSDFSSL